MSAALALPVILASTVAVAEPEMPVSRPRPLGGLAFYRRHTEALLHRYLVTSMVIGRAPCILGNVVFRGRVTSYRMQSFEDQIIFVFDVEKCLKRLDRVSQEVVAHISLENYTPQETAALMSESLRSVARIYAQALDRLTRLFLETRLLRPDLENLSRGAAENESNE
jgi:hypothetical protein